MMSEFTDEELSAYLDDDLPPARAAELERELASPALQQRLGAIRAVRGARLADVAPTHDLWPGIATRIGRERWSRPRWWLVAAAALLGVAAGALGARSLHADEPIAARGLPGQRFVLLLHEGPEMRDPASPAEAEAIVGRYRDWARDLDRRGALETGEKLADGEGFVLRAATDAPRTQRDGIGGLFVVRAADYAAARALARTCPHLALGGSIELRRIDGR
jgi:hypothetical protein